MAPRGGTRGRAPTGRDASKSSHQSKPNTRGRIQKKQGGTPKVDVDGDRDMDGGPRKAPAAKSGGGAKANGLASRTTSTNPRGGKSKITQAVERHLRSGGPNLKTLRVRGLKESKAASNPDGGKSSLLAFLERKASSHDRQVAIKKYHEAGTYILISATDTDAAELLKLNNFVFAGANLEITEAADEISSRARKATESEATQGVRAQLQLALQMRHDKDLKLLKLNMLASDPVLTQLGAFENPERARKTFKSLMVLCDDQFRSQREKDEAIISITLAENNIQKVDEIESLAATFPRLKNLDMRSNQIASIAGLLPWKGKLKELENIYLQGNPVIASEPNYLATLVEYFPKLQCVDDVVVQTPEQVAQRAAASGPKPIPQNGPLFRDVDGIGQAFLLDFFPLFDNDRYLIATRYYDEGSCFSLAVDTHSARDPNSPAPLPWGAYIKTSRNFSKIKSPNARVQRLFTGAGAIHDNWKSMPQTRHPSIKDEFVKYIADCHPLSGIVDPTGQNPMGGDGLIICIHGEFEEYDTKTSSVGKRSFSRTFVLGRGRPGNWPVRVVSDMLSLRAFSPLPNIYPVADNGEVAPTQPAGGDVATRQAMMAELSKRTGLTMQYAELCLVQVEWNFDRALVVFEEKKAQLPSEAWTVPPQVA